MSNRFCVDCKFYKKSELGWDFSKCLHPVRREKEEVFVNNVIGCPSTLKHTSYCERARERHNDPCSYEGKLWEPKETPITFFKKLKGLFTK